MPPTQPPTFDPDGSYHNLSSFWGRVKHFISVLDPRMLTTSQNEIKRCESIINDFRRGTGHHANQELWDCKKELDASLHPFTKEIIPLPFRMAAFTPVNIPICYGMLTCAPASPMMLFWHWFNQSYNTAVNYCNRAGGEVNMKQIMQSYTLAVATSCSLVIGMGKLANKIPALKSSPAIVSYVAVAAAGVSNIMFSRQNELFEGSPVTDEQGKVYGNSQIAGRSVVLQTAVSRGLFIPMPVLLLPHLIMKTLAAQVQVVPRFKLALELLVITGALTTALPIALAAFPQRASFKVENLEPEFQQLTDMHGRPIRVLYTNKGL